MTGRGSAGATLVVTDASSAAVGEVTAGRGIALEELTTVRESLEDVFLRLTGDGRAS